MYTNAAQSQQYTQNSLNLRSFQKEQFVANKKDSFSKKGSFPRKNSSLPADILAIVDSYRGHGKAIAYLLLSYQSMTNVLLKNETIARAIGCPVRTVQRWTARMVKDGIITKNQIDHLGFYTNYAVNSFRFPFSASQSFNIWMKQNPEQAMLYMTHGITIKKDGSIRYSYQSDTPLYNYIYNKTLLVHPTAHARVVDGDGWGCLTKKQKRERVLKRKMDMLIEAQREYIQKNKTQPGLKQVLSSPTMQKELFGESIETIAEILQLNDREKLKLIAYPTQTVSYVAEIVRGMASRRVKDPIQIDDRLYWMFGMLKKQCLTAKLKIDWRWYFDVCSILGVVPMPDDASGGPISLGIVEDNHRKSINKSYRDPLFSDVKILSTVERLAAAKAQEASKPTQSIADQIAYLEKQIGFASLHLSDPHKYFKFAVKESIKREENNLLEYREQLQLLKQPVT